MGDLSESISQLLKDLILQLLVSTWVDPAEIPEVVVEEDTGEDVEVIVTEDMEVEIDTEVTDTEMTAETGTTETGEKGEETLRGEKENGMRRLQGDGPRMNC